VKFTKCELRELVEHFDMEDIVRVPLPNNREDLLIYTFIKMNTGGTHAYMKSILLNRMLVARAAAARLLFGRWTMHSY
jgi:hypothetical protein